MEINKQTISRGSSNEFIIRVINDGKDGISGKLEHIKSGQFQYFEDYLEMLMLIQQKLDLQEFPQSDTELRTFKQID